MGMSIYTIVAMQDAVRQFQLKVLPPGITVNMQLAKLTEELSEALKAQSLGKRTDLVDAIGDMFYVILGVANLAQVDLETVFNRIHDSNMTKTRDGTLSPKGAGYVPPVLPDPRPNYGNCGVASHLTEDGNCRVEH